MIEKKFEEEKNNHGMDVPALHCPFLGNFPAPKQGGIMSGARVEISINFFPCVKNNCMFYTGSDCIIKKAAEKIAVRD